MTLLRNPSTAYANSAKPSTRFGSPARLPLKSGSSVAFLQFGLPADLVKGATILSATLTVHEVGAWPASRTLSVQRNSAAWKVSQVNWNNKPGLTGSAVSLLLGPTADQAAWSFNVAADVQAWVNGTAGKFGWRLSTNDSTLRYISGATATKGKPTLEVVYTYGPPTPTDLHPSAGAVSISNPRLRFSAGDFDSVNVQIDPSANATSPSFDSGWIFSTAGEFDLSGSTYVGLADGATTSWRVRVRKGAQVSSWSNWATFSRTNKPTLTISDPTATVYESTPPFNSSLSSGVFTKVRWRVALALSPQTYLYDSKAIPSGSGDVTPQTPVFTQLGVNYLVTVNAWDAVVREETFGDPPYMTASVVTTLVNDPGGPPVNWLDAAQPGPEPWVDVRWGWTATEPDGWAIFRNDVLVQTFNLAADANVSGSVYEWRDYTAPPNQTLTYAAVPVINGKASAPSALAEVTVNGQGVWLFDPETGDALVVWGDDAGTFANGEDATTFRPIGASEVVRITNSISGLEGQVTGVLLDTDIAEDYPALTCEATLNSFIGAEQVYRLALGHRNFPVRIFEVSPTVSPLTDPDQTVVPVAFGFTQAGELPFTVS